MKTTVKINKTFNNGGNLKGIASVNFDECFAVTGIRIIDSPKGLFVAMPGRKLRNGGYTNVCFPVTKEFREELYGKILDAYHQKLEESQENEKKNDKKQDRSTNSAKNHAEEQDSNPSPEEEQGDVQENCEESEGMSMGM